MCLITNSLNPPSTSTHNPAEANSTVQSPFESLPIAVVTRILNFAFEIPKNASNYSLVAKHFHLLIFGDLALLNPLWKKVFARHFPEPQITPLNGNYLEAYKKNHRFCINLDRGNYTSRTIDGYGGRNVAVAADGLILAESDESYNGREGRVGIWNLKTGDLEGSLGAAQMLASVAFSDKKLICGEENGMITIWDVKTGTIKKAFEAHNDPVASIVIADGQIISTCYWDELIRIWNLETGALVREIDGAATLHEQKQIYQFTIADGKIIADCSNDITIWDIDTGALLFRSPVRNEFVILSLFVLHGKIFISTGESFKIYDLKTLKLEFESADEYMKSVKFHTSANGRIISSTEEGTTVVIWNTKAGKVEQIVDFDPDINLVDFVIDSVSCVDGRVIIGTEGIAPNEEVEFQTTILDFLAETGRGKDDHPITPSPKRIKLTLE